MRAILFERQQQLGAQFFERDGVMMPADYGDVRGEHDALQTDAGLIDLANFGALRIDGRDRVAWLHKLVTANVQALAVGQSAYSLLLNAKGHVAADFFCSSKPMRCYSTQVSVQKKNCTLICAAPSSAKNFTDRCK